MYNSAPLSDRPNPRPGTSDPTCRATRPPRAVSRFVRRPHSAGRLPELFLTPGLGLPKGWAGRKRHCVLGRDSVLEARKSIRL